MRLNPFSFMCYHDRRAVEKVFPSARVAASCDIVEIFSYDHAMQREKVALPSVCTRNW